jgi:hypothetical protein
MKEAAWARRLPSCVATQRYEKGARFIFRLKQINLTPFPTPFPGHAGSRNRSTENPLVGSSIPPLLTIYLRRAAQLNQANRFRASTSCAISSGVVNTCGVTRTQ